MCHLASVAWYLTPLVNVPLITPFLSNEPPNPISYLFTQKSDWQTSVCPGHPIDTYGHCLLSYVVWFFPGSLLTSYCNKKSTPHLSLFLPHHDQTNAEHFSIFSTHFGAILFLQKHTPSGFHHPYWPNSYTTDPT